MAEEAVNKTVVAGLADRKCEACKSRGGNPQLLSTEEVKTLMAQLCPSWSLSGDGKLIKKEFTAKNFKAAMAFINGCGDVAEEEGHHPDLHIESYRMVTVVLSTHSLGGLSMNDFIVAAKIDRVPATYR